MASIVNSSRFAVVGLGQLGGSLGLRLKAVGCLDVLGLSRSAEKVQAAAERQVISCGSTQPETVLPFVDVTFLCMPLTATVEFVKTNLAHFRFGSVVTDVGSVKGSIQAELRELLLKRGVYFFGSHPMAGSEQSGLEACCADLYDGATVFMTPTPEDDDEALHLLAEVWREIGAIPIELEAPRHDAAVAHTSHLPHLISAAIVRTALNAGDVEAHTMSAAGGFRDMSRVAAGNVHMWTDICRHNTAAILDCLATFEEEMAAARKFLETGDWEGLSGWLARAKELRDGWPDRERPTPDAATE